MSEHLDQGGCGKSTVELEQSSPYFINQPWFCSFISPARAEQSRCGGITIASTAVYQADNSTTEPWSADYHPREVTAILSTACLNTLHGCETKWNTSAPFYSSMCKVKSCLQGRNKRGISSHQVMEPLTSRNSVETESSGYLSTAM